MRKEEIVEEAEKKMIEIESTGNPSLDMFITDVPNFLREIIKVIPTLDDAAQDALWLTIGESCFQTVKRSRERQGIVYPTDLTMEEAVRWVRDTEHSLDSLKREFYKEIDGKRVLVKEREYETSYDGETVHFESGIGRKYNNKCTCLLVNMGLVSPEIFLCEKCQRGLQSAYLRYLTGGKYPEHDGFECPENNINGCDHCHAILHYPRVKQEHHEFA